jgi:hypothetical protein
MKTRKQNVLNVKLKDVLKWVIFFIVQSVNMICAKTVTSIEMEKDPKLKGRKYL